jgi:RNA polymerase sigma factor (sigma-70 family)
MLAYPDFDQVEQEKFKQLCHTIARQLIGNYGWTLLTEAELVTQVLRLLSTNATPGTIQKLVLDQYTLALYTACRQHEDQLRREQGYRELYQLLVRSATKWRPEQADHLAEEVAQRALMLIFEQLDRCQTPATFMAFALYKLRQAFTEAERAGAKQSVSLDEEVEHVAMQQRATDLWQGRETQTELQELLRVVLAALTDERVRQVITLKFLEGWSDQEIGQILGITANHVRVLRNRGLAQIRQDERIAAYFRP